MSRAFPDPPRAAWSLTLCPGAGEAGGSYQSPRGRGSLWVPPEVVVDEERLALMAQRSRDEAARRARAKVRRYAVANGLNRLGTLTYSGAGCHDPAGLRADVAVFFRRLRSALGQGSIPYVWVPEWHPGGHGLHAHFGVDRFVPRGLIESAWGRGHVHIKLLGDLPIGATVRMQARRAAGYLAKYVGKTFEQGFEGRHRYEVGQGFQPESRRFFGRSVDQVLDQACEVMGGRPERSWYSGEVEGWDRPAAAWFQWA